MSKATELSQLIHQKLNAEEQQTLIDLLKEPGIHRLIKKMKEPAFKALVTAANALTKATGK